MHEHDPGHGERDGASAEPTTEPDDPGPAGPLLRIVGDRRVAFLIVGAVNTLSGVVWFVLFDRTIGQLWGYMVTLLFAHVAAVLCAFVLYRRFVFRVTGNVLVDLARFESVYLVGLGINLVLLPLAVEVGGLEPIVAQLLIVFVTTIVSYVGHSRFSFRRPSDPSAPLS
ncbi:GtrA family protein [Aeromicrobium sp.]|uniref:GtrA family protein n=1 Tax=Aeromicrobium sp. TaxID=1871063 RepID=UPI0025C72FFA|nr:GtrA family protein [Aeromicrobium sp.]MCK5891272.1 GtrA family protein [Aeromicrobium sp.]